MRKPTVEIWKHIVSNQKECWHLRQEGCVSKQTRTWVIYSICRDWDKESKGRNQADTLWHMFAKALFIITVASSWKHFNLCFQLLTAKKVYSFVKSIGRTGITFLWRLFMINFPSKEKKNKSIHIEITRNLFPLKVPERQSTKCASDKTIDERFLPTELPTPWGSQHNLQAQEVRKKIILLGKSILSNDLLWKWKNFIFPSDK